LARGWAVELGYVGTHYIGGIGIWDPFIARCQFFSPVAVKDMNGVSYSITTNTVNNEELRHQILGLSRRRGSRYSGNIGLGHYNSSRRRFLGGCTRVSISRRLTLARRRSTMSSGSQSTDELNATRNGQGGANILNLQDNPQANKARSDF